jgi:hypothetical protein
MAELVKRPKYKVLDKVRLKHGSRFVGTITEAHGTYNPDGNVLYEVYVPLDPEPLRFLLHEDEIDKVEDETAAPPTS